MEKIPPSIRHWDTNPQPSDYESPPLTTRPGLTSKKLNSLFRWFLLYLRVDNVASRIKYHDRGTGESYKRTERERGGNINHEKINICTLFVVNHAKSIDK